MTSKKSPTQIDVWHADTARLTKYDRQHLLKLLPVVEQQRYKNISHPRRRHEFLLGRAMVRQQFSLRYGVSPQEWHIKPNENGKPKIYANPIRIDFSISHSSGVVTCAVSEHGSLGLDIEQVSTKRDIDSIAGRIFNITEQNWFDQRDKQIKLKRFYRLWTLKEAWAKSTGAGIGAILQGVDLIDANTVRQPFDDDNFGFFCNAENLGTSDHWLCHFELLENMAGAIALKKENDWQPPILHLHDFIYPHSIE